MQLLDKYIRSYFKNFSIMKICKLVAVFHFRLQKFLIAGRFAIKFLFHTIGDFILATIFSQFFQQLFSSNRKKHRFNFTIMAFYICTLFRKHYMLWFKYIILITYVTKKILKIFFSRKETILGTCMLSIFISSNKVR